MVSVVIITRYVCNGRPIVCFVLQSEGDLLCDEQINPSDYESRDLGGSSENDDGLCISQVWSMDHDIQVTNSDSAW